MCIHENIANLSQSPLDFCKIIVIIEDLCQSFLEMIEFPRPPIMHPLTCTTEVTIVIVLLP